MIYETRLRKTIKGKEIMDKLKDKYMTLDNLKKLYNTEKNSKNSRIYLDLEEWKHYEDKIDDDIKQTVIMLTEEPPLGKIELKILNIIKSDNPQSIEDLAILMGKDIDFVNEKIKYLAVNRFIELDEVSKNIKVPIFPFESLQIVIGDVPFSHNSELDCDGGEVYENAN